MEIKTVAAKAKQAAILMGGLPSDTKNQALLAVARGLDKNRERIRAANQMDLDRSQKEALPGPLLKRLRFDDAKVTEAIAGLTHLKNLPDPVGKTLRATELDQGLELYQVTCPIGVIGVVFESRPDALVQISALCLKSGNASLLKGGTEAMETNRVLAEILLQAGQEAGLPEGFFSLLKTRSDVKEMLALDPFIDLIIPRGSNAFVQEIMHHTRIPVLGHADGICHVYVDREADVDMAVRIVVDSKCQYVAVCNAAETLLVHEGIAREVLPRIKKALEEKGVELRGCPGTRALIDVKEASEEDWRTEYLDLILSIRLVNTLADAIAHINQYGSGHTDAIVTRDRARGLRFIQGVDSADVFLNCSTRFSDGFRYGLGAEVGISTNKIHARGPVGLEGLVIYQWRLLGNGHIVADYAGDGARPFTHRPLQKGFEG